MSKISSIALASLLTLAAWHTSAANGPETGAGGKAKVVIQVSDDDQRKWNLALSNAKNIQKDLGVKNVEIEIVAFGPGVAMLKADATTAARVREANEDGVQLNACANTMAALKLKKEDMNPAAGVVPSGAGEIVKKQLAGYAYLRP